MPENFKFDNVSPRGEVGIERDGFDYDYETNTVPATDHPVSSSDDPQSPLKRFEREMFIRAAIDTSLAQVELAVQTPYDPAWISDTNVPVINFGVADLFKIHHVESVDAPQWTMNKKSNAKPTYSLKRKKNKQRRNQK